MDDNGPHGAMLMPDIMGRIAYATPCERCKYRWDHCYCKGKRDIMCLVCKPWRQAVLDSATTLRNSFAGLYDERLGVPHGMNHDQIRTLNIWTPHYDDDEPPRPMPVLSEFNKLHKLYIDFSCGNNVTLFIPKEILGIQSLRELELLCPMLESLDVISAATQLTMLHLEGLIISNPKGTSLKELSGLTGLRDLTINHIRLHDYDSDSDSEEDLQIRTHYELRHLSPLVNLTRLIFNEFDDPNSLEVIAQNFTALEVLRFDCSQGGWPFSPGLSIRSDLNPLSACVSLRELSFTWTNIKDISALASLTNLETLDLRKNNLLMTESIRSLSRLSTLKKLILTNCDSITYLSSLSHLPIINCSFDCASFSFCKCG